MTWLMVVDFSCFVSWSTNETICLAKVVKSTNFVWATLQQLSQRVSKCFLHWLDKYCSPKYSSNNVRRQSTLLRQYAYTRCRFSMWVFFASYVALAACSAEK